MASAVELVTETNPPPELETWLLARSAACAVSVTDPAPLPPIPSDTLPSKRAAVCPLANAMGLPTLTLINPPLSEASLASARLLDRASTVTPPLGEEIRAADWTVVSTWALEVARTFNTPTVTSTEALIDSTAAEALLAAKNAPLPPLAAGLKLCADNKATFPWELVTTASALIVVAMRGLITAFVSRSLTETAPIPNASPRDFARVSTTDSSETSPTASTIVLVPTLVLTMGELIALDFVRVTVPRMLPALATEFART